MRRRRSLKEAHSCSAMTGCQSGASSEESSACQERDLRDWRPSRQLSGGADDGGRRTLHSEATLEQDEFGAGSPHRTSLTAEQTQRLAAPVTGRCRIASGSCREGAAQQELATPSGRPSLFLTLLEGLVSDAQCVQVEPCTRSTWTLVTGMSGRRMFSSSATRSVSSSSRSAVGRSPRAKANDTVLSQGHRSRCCPPLVNRASARTYSRSARAKAPPEVAESAVRDGPGLPHVVVACEQGDRAVGGVQQITVLTDQPEGVSLAEADTSTAGLRDAVGCGLDLLEPFTGSSDQDECNAVRRPNVGLSRAVTGPGRDPQPQAELPQRPRRVRRSRA